ncbi:MAG: polysaccharide deacetylase family protein [Terriglobia bacterium]
MTMINTRAEFIPIIDRKPLQLPGGARVAVWVAINVELWDLNAPTPRQISEGGKGLIPDVANYSWYEYGMRVGLWRLKGILDKHRVKATISLNGAVCESHPGVVDEMMKSGWEMMGHGYVQKKLPSESDERSAIKKTIDAIKQKTGRPPRGWLGPGLAETFDTPDILAEEGIEYVADWVNDDLPYPMKVKKGTLYSIPYTLELNDGPIFMGQHHRSPEIFRRARDYFDTLYSEAEQGARVMAIAVHPFITGVPHRSKYFDDIFIYMKRHTGVAFMTGGEILDWYKAATAAGR